MKVIDLLNQIANGEAPKKIKVNKNILNLKIGKGTSYEFETGGGMLSFDYYIENNKLDTIVEIIEEKKIPEKINIKFWSDEEYTPEQRINVCMTYIDEIIDYLDYLKSKGDE